MIYFYEDSNLRGYGKLHLTKLLLGGEVIIQSNYSKFIQNFVTTLRALIIEGLHGGAYERVSSTANHMARKLDRSQKAIQKVRSQQ